MSNRIVPDTDDTVYDIVIRGGLVFDAVTTEGARVEVWRLGVSLLFMTAVNDAYLKHR